MNNIEITKLTRSSSSSVAISKRQNIYNFKSETQDYNYYMKKSSWNWCISICFTVCKPSSQEIDLADLCTRASEMLILIHSVSNDVLRRKTARSADFIGGQLASEE
jgi:hypothetical protein